VSTGASVRNNLLLSNSGGAINNSGVNTTIGFNVCDSGCTYSSTAAAELVTPGSNFQLKAGAVSIDKGENLGAPYNVDILNVSRPQPSGGAWDIGAYESTGGGGGPAPNTPPLEDFVYTTGTALAGANGGTNFTGAWTDGGCGGSFTVQTAPANSFSGGNAATSTSTTQNCASRAFTAVGTGSVIWQMSNTVTTGYSAIDLLDSAGNHNANVALKADGHIHACADYSGDIDLGAYSAGQVNLIEAQFDATNQTMKARYRVNEGTYTAWIAFCAAGAAASLVDHIALFDNTG